MNYRVDKSKVGSPGVVTFLMQSWCSPEHTKEMFMEAKKSFAEASTLGSKDQPKPGMDTSMLTTFLET